MSLNLILGPMFAGKSSELLGTIRKYNAIGWPILVITHSVDTRYSTEPEIVSHNDDRYPAIRLCDLSQVNKALYRDARLIIIEEAQIFTGLREFVLKAVEVHAKDVICVGLDGDADRLQFGEILSLIPYCDTVTKRHAFCKRCPTPTPAIFTARIGARTSTEQVAIGGKELYEPLCRKHYLEIERYTK